MGNDTGCRNLSNSNSKQGVSVLGFEPKTTNTRLSCISYNKKYLRFSTVSEPIKIIVISQNTII